MKDLEFHPLCLKFPQLSDKELKELAEDIKINSLLFPIIKHKDGRILDGRNRYLACKLAGVAPKFVVYNGNNPLYLVISANIKRRSLTSKQKRGLIEELLLEDPEKTSRSIAGMIGVNHETVSSVRHSLIEEGRIEPRTLYDNRITPYPVNREYGGNRQSQRPVVAPVKLGAISTLEVILGFEKANLSCDQIQEAALLTEEQVNAFMDALIAAQSRIGETIAWIRKEYPGKASTLNLVKGG